MDPENSSKQNTEVYRPSFEEGGEKSESRENSKDLPEQVKQEEGVENAEVLELEKSLNKAEEAIGMANLKAKISLTISKKFYSIPRMTNEEIKDMQRAVPQMFQGFVGSAIAAANLLRQEISEAQYNNTKIEEAGNLEEFKALTEIKEADIAEIEKRIDNMIENANMAYLKFKGEYEDNTKEIE